MDIMLIYEIENLSVIFRIDNMKKDNYKILLPPKAVCPVVLLCFFYK